MSSGSENKIVCKGRVAVYAGNHRLMDSRIYYTSDGLKKIMDKWMEDYPDGGYIQVRPYTSETNEPIKYRVPYNAKIGTARKRHPPTYSNIPTYDYSERKNGKH